jgi:hypothetical protein
MNKFLFQLKAFQIVASFNLHKVYKVYKVCKVCKVCKVYKDYRRQGTLPVYVFRKTILFVVFYLFRFL